MAIVTYTVAASGGDWTDIDDLSSASAQNTIDTAAQSNALVQIFVEQGIYGSQALYWTTVAPAGNNRVQIIFLGNCILHGGRADGNGNAIFLPEEGHSTQDFTDTSTENYGIRFGPNCRNITVTGQSWYYDEQTGEVTVGLEVHGYQDAGTFTEVGTENIYFEYVESHNNGTVSWNGSAYEVSLTGFCGRVNGTGHIYSHCYYHDSTQDIYQAGSNSDVGDLLFEYVVGGNTRPHSGNVSLPWTADTEAAVSHSDFLQAYSATSNTIVGITFRSCFAGPYLTQNLILGTGVTRNDDIVAEDCIIVGAYGAGWKGENGTGNAIRRCTMLTVDGGSFKMIWFESGSPFELEVTDCAIANFGAGGLDFDIPSSTGSGSVWNDSSPDGTPPSGSYSNFTVAGTINNNGDFLTEDLTPQGGAAGLGSATISKRADVFAHGNQTPSSSGGTTTITATEFTHISAEHPTVNYFGSEMFARQGSSDGFEREIYIRFDLSQFTTEITAAILGMEENANGNGAQTIDAHKLTGSVAASLDFSAMNWNTVDGSTGWVESEHYDAGVLGQGAYSDTSGAPMSVSLDAVEIDAEKGGDLIVVLRIPFDSTFRLARFNAVMPTLQITYAASVVGDAAQESGGASVNGALLSRLSVTAYEYDDSNNLEYFYDWTGRLLSLTLTTGENGFLAADGVVRLPVQDAFEIYNRQRVLDLIVSDGAENVWEGRAAFPAIVAEGLQLNGLGHFVAMKDDLYTELWSDDSYGLWREMTTDDVSTRTSEKYRIDNNQRLYIALVKNNEYQNGLDVGALTYAIPDRGVRDLSYITFSYDVTLPTNWLLQIRTWAQDFAGGASSITTIVTGNGSNQTGTYSATLATPDERVEVNIINSTGSLYTNTDETGDWYAKLTAVRVSSSADPVSPQAILQDVVGQISALNPGRLSSDTSFILDSGLELTNEVYEDADPADIARKMAALGDASGNVWTVAVWLDKTLQFYERGTNNRSWYVNSWDLELRRTDAELVNVAYGVYRDSYGNRRTADSSDAASINDYGFTRRRSVQVQSGSLAEAETQRDLLLADKATAIPAASVKIERLQDEAGGYWPLWMARAGDRVTIKNLPASTGRSEVDRIHTFLLIETRYDAIRDELEITPERPLPSLEFYLTRLSEGI